MSPLISEFLLVAGVHLLAVASPGPDFAIVFQSSVRRGRAVALWTSFGIGTGIFFHAGYSILGIGILLKNYPQFFEILRYAGAIYLAFLGVKAIFSKAGKNENNAEENSELDTSNRSRSAFLTGLLVNLLNPKVALFFIALFTVGVSQETPLGVKIFYGVWMALMTMAWFSAVSFFFTWEKLREKFLRNGHWFDRAMGALLLILAARLALSEI